LGGPIRTEDIDGKRPWSLEEARKQAGGGETYPEDETPQGTNDAFLNEPVLEEDSWHLKGMFLRSFHPAAEKDILEHIAICFFPQYPF